MIERIIIAGSGGQGVMLLGKVLVSSAMKEGKFVTWLPAYGPEVRGGAAHCMVVISDSEIGSPFVDKADSLIIMNSQSLDKFKNRLKENGIMILNNSLADINIKKSLVIKYPFTDIAQDLGNIKVANMVALGCFLAHKKIAGLKSVFSTIVEFAPAGKKELIEVNKKAILKGMELKK
ncbi:MAG: 2-oxoacid:acceptor oxidoreductase family protein [Candidatus Omnitrophica bacterium]|nr:2-oxoacid:acceptor oxidoreductase family protein [Candidatus Omnitrophota bacterium]